MNILTMLCENVWHGTMAFRFPARPPVTDHYRGLVRFDPELCTGCAMCRFRCTARAITFSSAKTEFTWSYDPAQCTFCGRCVEGCKTHALSQESSCPPVYQILGSLKHSYTIARKPPSPKPVAATPTSAGSQSPPASTGGVQ